MLRFIKIVPKATKTASATSATNATRAPPPVNSSSPQAWGEWSQLDAFEPGPRSSLVETMVLVSEMPDDEWFGYIMMKQTCFEQLLSGHPEILPVPKDGLDTAAAPAKPAYPGRYSYCTIEGCTGVSKKKRAVSNKSLLDAELSAGQLLSQFTVGDQSDSVHLCKRHVFDLFPEFRCRENSCINLSAGADGERCYRHARPLCQMYRSQPRKARGNRSVNQRCNRLAKTVVTRSGQSVSMCKLCAQNHLALK